MPKRDFIHTTDFTKEDYVEIFRRMKIFDDGVKAGRDFSYLLRGKVLASMFLKESTRSMTAFQAAIIRLGGGWTGLTGVQGTYLGSGEEDIGDIVRSISQVSDVMALRYNDCDPRALANMIDIPLINAMCGGEEHASGSITLIYPMFKRWGTLENKKIGVYGMVSSSRPMKAVLSALAPFGVTFIIDPVVNVFKTPTHIAESATGRGATIEYKPVDEWINQVDALMWVEGLPQTGEPEENVDAFNKAFHQFTLEDTARIRPDCLFQAFTPRKTTDGRLTMAMDVDNHPQNITWETLNAFQFAAMALMTYLLEVEVS